MDVLRLILDTSDDHAAAAAVALFAGDINVPECSVLIWAMQKRLHRTITSLGARGDCDAELKFPCPVTGDVLYPIHVAAIYGMVAPVLWAFLHVDVDRRGRDGMTALHFSCGRGAMDDVKTLLAHGADPTLCDRYGRTADVGVADPELAVEIRRLFARATGDRSTWMRACVSVVNAF